MDNQKNNNIDAKDAQYQKNAKPFIGPLPSRKIEEQRLEAALRPLGKDYTEAAEVITSPDPRNFPFDYAFFHGKGGRPRSQEEIQECLQTNFHEIQEEDAKPGDRIVWQNPTTGKFLFAAYITRENREIRGIPLNRGGLHSYQPFHTWEKILEAQIIKTTMTKYPHSYKKLLNYLEDQYQQSIIDKTLDQGEKIDTKEMESIRAEIFGGKELWDKVIGTKKFYRAELSYDLEIIDGNVMDPKEAKIIVFGETHDRELDQQLQEQILEKYAKEDDIVYYENWLGETDKKLASGINVECAGCEDEILHNNAKNLLKIRWKLKRAYEKGKHEKVAFLQAQHPNIEKEYSEAKAARENYFGDVIDARIQQSPDDSTIFLVIGEGHCLPEGQLRNRLAKHKYIIYRSMCQGFPEEKAAWAIEGYDPLFGEE